MVDWSDLEPELLEEIALRVYSNSIVDYFRSSLVCKPWKSVFGNKPIRKSLPLIMEILPENSANENDSCRFFTIKGDVVRRFNHPNISYLDGRSCKGCGYGWIVVTDTNTYNYGEVDDLYNGYEEGIYLLNPITRQEIRLPSLTTLPYIVFGRVQIGIAVISSCPGTLNNDENSCTVIASCDSYMNCADVLICCKLGDQSWQIIQDSRLGGSSRISSLLCFDGVVYAAWNGFEGVVICDVNHSPPRVRPNVEITGFIVVDDGGFSSLIESCGELLQIRLYYHNETLNVLKFTVFRLEKNGQIWVEVKSLGDRVLFYSLESSFSLIASDHTGLKPNCVYFIDFIDDDDNDTTEMRCGIFNLADGGIEYLEHNFESPCQDGSWIEPFW